MTLNLSPLQQQIVSHGDGPLLVIAGPGSGKTRVLTERIRRLICEKDGHFKILALTFTNKAANEMRERLKDMPDIVAHVFIGTLHSFCIEVLINRGKAIGIDGAPHIFESFQDRKQILLQAVMDDVELKQLLLKNDTIQKQNSMLANWLEHISRCKNDLLLPEAIEDTSERRIYEAYNAGLKACAALDFDDLLVLTYRLFEERPKIADFYRRQYRYICVDEAQDLNNAQYRVICALCSKSFKNVMMVGDPKQAIYAWNGADTKYLSLFEKDFNAKTILLNENYRSSKAIVRAAQMLDSRYVVEGQLPIEGGMEIISCGDEEAEADLIINKIEMLTNAGHKDIEGDITLDRCAVLGRTRYVFSKIEAKLKERGWGYYKQLSAQHGSESDVFKQFELGLRLLANPLDRLHLGILINQLNLTHTIDDILARFDLATITGLSLLGELLNRSATAHSQVIRDAIDALNWTDSDFTLSPALNLLEEYINGFTDEDRALGLQDLSQWRNHWNYFLRTEKGGHHSLSTFLSQIALGETQQPKGEGLALLTIHSAKGLEFDIVFLIAMCEGIFPDYRARGIALEEERRNAFVAVTRAKRLLFLTFPETRMMPWGTSKAQNPSSFLALLNSPRPHSN